MEILARAQSYFAEEWKTFRVDGESDIIDLKQTFMYEIIYLVVINVFLTHLIKNNISLLRFERY